MSDQLPPGAEERIDKIMEQVRKELEEIFRWSQGQGGDESVRPLGKLPSHHKSRAVTAAGATTGSGIGPLFRTPISLSGRGCCQA